MNKLDTTVLSLFFVFKKIFLYIFYIIMIIYETFK